MDQNPKINPNVSDPAKTGGTYGAGNLSAGPSNMDSTVGNNPRIDLLHNSGSNTAAPISATPVDSNKFAAASTAAAPATPTPVPQPQPAPAPPIAPKHRSAGKVIITILTVLILIGAAGGGLWIWTQQQTAEEVSPSPAPVALQAAAPTQLAVLDGTSTVALGGKISQNKASFTFTLETQANTGSATPEIEIQPLGTAFTGTPTHTGDQKNADGSDISLSVLAEGLKNGSYHWQARTVVDGQESDWTVAGDGQTADFSIEAVAAQEATPQPAPAPAPVAATTPPPPPPTPVAPTPAPVESQEPTLAKTGHPTAPVSAAAVIVLLVSLTGALAIRRYGWR